MAAKKFEKGRKKTGGRERGTRNKFTTLKDAFINAFNSKEMGGEKGMTEIFSANSFTKREFYKLISKMLPSNVAMDLDGKLDITIKRKVTKENPEE